MNIFVPEWFMPFATKRAPLILSAEQKQALEEFRRSRTGEKRGIQHAALLLDAAAGMSDGAVARRNGVNRHKLTRERKVERHMISEAW
jgi:hypothetical protein